MIRLTVLSVMEALRRFADYEVNGACTMGTRRSSGCARPGLLWLGCGLYLLLAVIIASRALLDPFHRFLGGLGIHSSSCGIFGGSGMPSCTA
ncbi:hypothetical protein GCM10025857_10990 [Alicyclobacillus contaminans]|nr:hypothetical protein GCM10025857_10990 [Alicyclobacillus contaminans]